MKIKNITDAIEEFAPKMLAEPWDNPGLMIGSLSEECTGVVTALDLTFEVVAEAIENCCNLIVTHHPFFFTAIKSINTDEAKGALIKKVLENGITVYSAHTNVDECDGGLCQTVAKMLGGENLNPNGVGVVCDIKPTTLGEFAKHVASVLSDDTVKFTGNANKEIKSMLCICGGGAGDSAYECAKQVADVFVTGDFKHHLYVASQNDDFPIVEFSHYHSEIAVEQLFENIIAPLGVKIIKAKQTCPFTAVGEYHEI